MPTMRKVDPLPLGDDFTVDDDIQLDARQVDEIFSRCLNKGAKAYLDRLERLSSHEIDFGRDEGSKMAVGFEGMRKFIQQKKNGYQNIKVADFQDFGIPLPFISKIRYLVHRLDTASPRLSTNRDSKGGKRLSTMTASSVQDDCEDDYGDDFEDDEEDSRGSFGDRKGGKRESRASKDMDDEILDIIDEEEEEEDENGHSEAAVMPFTPSFRKAPESPTKYNREKINSFSMRPNSGSGNTDSSSSVTIITTAVNPSGSASRRYGSAEKIRPKIDPKYDSSNSSSSKAEQRRAERAEMPPLSPKRYNPVVSRSASTPSVSMSQGGARASTAGLRRRVRNSTWINEGNWKLGEKIGTGSFGEVFKAMNDKGKLYAVKRLNMVGKLNEVEDLTREIELMKDLEHANIVGYVGAWVNEESGLVYIFQEWACGGSVAHLLKQFGPFQIKTIKNYTKQILLGLNYLHDNGIIHRDIKGGNVLIDTDTVKLADFGASTKMAFGETQSTSTIKGTPYFMAPETLSQSKYGRKGDIWAVGCTVIQMLTGEPPWKEKNLNGLVQLHMLLASWNGPPDYDREVPVELKECLEMCFAKEAEKRPTASALLLCPFLKDNLDESSNLTEQLGFTEPADNLDNSGIMLHDQIARAVTRHSFCALDKPGDGIVSNSVGSAIRSAGGWKQKEKEQDEDSTMGGIDRQIMQRERMKLKHKEEKANEADRERESHQQRDRERERGFQPHYQLNMPSRGANSGGTYSPYGYEDRDRSKEMDSASGDAKRLSPKDIADLVSQSSSQSANNPFAKGASPFSSKVKVTGSNIDSNTSRSSSHHVTPNRGRQGQTPDKSQNQIQGPQNQNQNQSQNQVQGPDKSHGKKTVQAFTEDNAGNASCEDEMERNGSSGYRNRVPYHDASLGPARNPFHSIVEEAKGIAGSSNSSRSLPSSPLMFPSSQSPSVLSSPVGASQRATPFKDDRYEKEKGKGIFEADINDIFRGGSYERNLAYAKRGGGGITGLSVSGGNAGNTNGELLALKKRTDARADRQGSSYSGADVGSGLDCDAGYEEENRRDKLGRFIVPDRRQGGCNNHSGRRDADLPYDSSHNNNRREDQPYRSFSAGSAGDDEDGEEPELDIIRTPGSSNKSDKSQQSDSNRTPISNSSSSSNLFPSKNSDSFLNEGSSSGKSGRMIHSASVARIRPPVAATVLRRPATTTTIKTQGGYNNPPRSAPNSARQSTRDNESGDDEGNGHGYRYDNMSSKSVGRAASGSGDRAIRGRSKEPTHRQSPPIVKKDMRQPVREPLDGNVSNSTIEDEEDEGRWQCLKCGEDNTNQYHCDHCATKRTAYSFAPDHQRIQRALPK